MSYKYSTGIRFNHHLGVLESLSFAGEGIGAALYILAFVTGQWPLAIIGIGFVAGAVVALLRHLGNPLRSWRAVRRVSTSPVSRGTAAISAFLIVAMLSVFAMHWPVPAPLQSGLAFIAAVLAVFVMVYAGMLLRSIRAIRLWRGAFVPLAFVMHSAATALVISVALLSVTDSNPAGWLQLATLASLALAALFSIIHLVCAEHSTGVRASLKRLLQGDLRSNFFLGAGIAGLAVPLVAVLMMGVSGASAILAVAALSRIYGDFAYRNSIVVAGAYEPLLPSWSQHTDTAKAAPVSAVPARVRA